MIPTYLKDPPAWFHTRVLVGAGAMLSPRFASYHGITHVVNCAFDMDSPVWFRTAHPDKYACMKAQDTLKHNILDWYPLFEKTLKSFLREGNGVVYVHCQAGMNRSGFLALTYICKNFGIDLNYAVPLLKRQRPCLFQNSVYMGQVKEFIYGRVQSQENPGVPVSGIHTGNAGLSASGDGVNTTRVENGTGISSGTTIGYQAGNFRPILKK